MSYSRYIKTDYKLDKHPHLHHAEHRKKGVHAVLPVVLSVGIGIVLFFGLNDASHTPDTTASSTDEAQAEQSIVIDLTLPGQTTDSDTGPSHTPKTGKPSAQQHITLALPAKPSPLQPQKPAVQQVQSEPEDYRRPAITLSVKKGDTLSALFTRAGLSANDLYTLLKDKAIKKRLRDMMPGQQFIIQADEEGYLQSLSWKINDTETLVVNRDTDGFTSQSEFRELERRSRTATGTIQNSLFLDGVKSGLSDKIIMEMVGVLGWDIDFALDLRKGDQFTVVYEELYNQQGEKVGDGHILATEFINRGQQVTGIRYTDPTGHTAYYSPDGHSMRKAFIRTPVDFARISSRFSLGRKHPILNKIRAHKGVDYAARTGTPVKAAGDGKIAFKGRKGGYGRTVIIQHGGTYTTLYAHLSKFNRKAKSGSRIKQGQIIGYVGQSGMATGPHLHYEFRVNGVHRNPLTVKLPKALPLAKKYRDDFEKKSRPLIAALELMQRTQIASNP